MESDEKKRLVAHLPDAKDQISIKFTSQNAAETVRLTIRNPDA